MKSSSFTRTSTVADLSGQLTARAIHTDMHAPSQRALVNRSAVPGIVQAASLAHSPLCIVTGDGTLVSEMMHLSAVALPTKPRGFFLE